MDLNLSGLIDRVCTELAARSPRAELPRRMVVHPQVYRCVAEAQHRQVKHHLPVMLLGMELQQSNLTPVTGFEILD